MSWIFAGLIVLAFVIVFFVKSRSNGKSAAPVAAAAASPAKMPEVQAGIDEETVAVIMAAISCMSQSASGVKYAVRNISRAKSERPVWGFAGVQQNTRPF